MQGTMIDENKQQDNTYIHRAKAMGVNSIRQQTQTDQESNLRNNQMQKTTTKVYALSSR
jgi:hypothetical protein